VAIFVGKKRCRRGNAMLGTHHVEKRDYAGVGMRGRMRYTEEASQKSEEDGVQKFLLGTCSRDWMMGSAPSMGSIR
jgi:hypothetical protein